VIPVYVISLPNAERRIKIHAELRRVGFEHINYVHAVEPVQGFTMSNMRRNPRGEFGCALSHLKAISQALEQGCKRALFVEDDITFLDGGIERFVAADLAIKLRLDILYLGGHPREKVQKTDIAGLVKPGKWSCAEAYCMDSRGMQNFIPFWCDRAGQPNAMFDFILGEWAAERDFAYAMYPPATEQRPGWSQIGQKFDDKRELIERGWRNNLAA